MEEGGMGVEFEWMEEGGGIKEEGMLMRVFE